MTIELEKSWVYPDDYGTVRPSGLEAPMPSLMIGRAVAERSSAYAKGHWREMMVLHLPRMKYTRPTPYKMDDFIKREFKVAIAADTIMLKSPQVKLPDAWNRAFDKHKADLSTKILAAPIEFSGGLLTPFAAIAHWIMGKGEQAKVDIKNIGISPSLQKSPHLKAAIENVIVGTSRIDINIPYDTGIDSAISRIYLGSVTLRVIGDVIKEANGSVSFEGAVRAYSDRYDANASSHRAGFDEGATSALRAVGRIANATDYEILIQGEMPLKFNMQR